MLDVIMVPPQNLYSIQQQQQPQYYQDYYCDDRSAGFMSRLVGYEYYCNEACLLGSDIVIIGPMAEDESRTSSVNEGGSTSKDTREDHRDDRWLQLGLSLGGTHMTTTSTTTTITGSEFNLDRVEPLTARRGGLVELDLLSTSPSSSQHVLPLTSTFHAAELRAPHPATNGDSGTGATGSISPPLFLQQYNPRTSFNFPHHQPHEIIWGYRPNNPWNSMAAASSSLPPSPLGSYYARPLIHHHQSIGMTSTASSDMRVVDAPRRPHSGVWFVLQASQNQAKEPFLPQIPKNYLRIKDGRITVRVLMKYVANKLRLNSESEVEITCRGQQLQPYLTLQHVRDNIWNTREVVTLLPHSSTTDHHQVMVLHYDRSTTA